MCATSTGAATPTTTSAGKAARMTWPAWSAPTPCCPTGAAAIAHAMISFGFDDGRHVVFSVEVRKSREQTYSSIGGFFKQFETILVAADERDIIRVRTNVRGEDDYLYPLRLDPSTLRSLFLSYVHAANRLAAQP